MFTLTPDSIGHLPQLITWSSNCSTLKYTFYTMHTSFVVKTSKFGSGVVVFVVGIFHEEEYQPVLRSKPKKLMTLDMDNHSFITNKLSCIFMTVCHVCLLHSPAIEMEPKINAQQNQLCTAYSQRRGPLPQPHLAFKTDETQFISPLFILQCQL